MPQMNTSQARIIDPVLTNLTVGYRNQAFVGGALFPRVSVAQRAAKYPIFDRNDFRLYRSRRAPGAKVQTVDLNYSSNPYALEDHNLDGIVPIELQQEAGAVPHINLQVRAVNKVQRSLGVRLEYDQATLARTAGGYGAQIVTYNGASSWKNAGSAPLVDISTARQAVLAATGVYPNTLLLADTAFDALRFHASIVDRLKYTSSASVTPSLIAGLTEVPNVVVGASTYIDDANAAQRIWGNDAILAYVPPSVSDNEEPSYGYTFTLEGYPNAEAVWWDGDRKAWRVPYNDSRVPALTGIASGYLFQNAGQ